MDETKKKYTSVECKLIRQHLHYLVEEMNDHLNVIEENLGKIKDSVNFQSEKEKQKNG